MLIKKSFYVHTLVAYGADILPKRETYSVQPGRKHVRRELKGTDKSLVTS